MRYNIQDHIISFECISTERMLADPLMIGLPPNMFREHVTSMGLRESLCFLDSKGPKARIHL